MGLAALSRHEITEQAHPKPVHTAPDVLVVLKQIVDIDTGGRVPAVRASIKVAILYNIFAQNPKMWRNAPKMAGGFRRFLGFLNFCDDF